MNGSLNGHIIWHCFEFLFIDFLFMNQRKFYYVGY